MRRHRSLAPTAGSLGDLSYILDSGANELWNRFLGANLADTSGYPKMDIYTTDDALTVEAAVPGMKRDEISIEIRDEEGRRYLIISGKKASHGEGRTRERYLHKELHLSTWRRTVDITSLDDTDSVTSKLSDGILTIAFKLPPKLQDKPAVRKINIS